MKVVINTRHGGFGLSPAAYEKLGLEWDGYGFAYRFSDDRTNPELVAVVEELGKRASGSFANLKIVEIPDDVEWEIQEYHGAEWVAEKHRTWP